MWLLLKGNIRRQFKAPLQGGAPKGKVSEGQKTLTFSTTQEEPPKKDKKDNGKNLVVAVVLFSWKKAQIVQIL